jgi:putative cardiolipin synthase
MTPLIRIAGLLLAAALLGGCAGLPPLEGRPETHALPPSADSGLGRAVLPAAREHPQLTGVLPVDDGRVAFGVRAALARNATRTIDIQTFIWHPDATGTLLFEEMMRAAERGVRVRLLLDDLNTAGTDPTLALLATQPGIELRLYNPFVGRGSRALGFLGDFERLNHRMHNKSFTVDGAVAVVGGRNIADEYYEIGDTGLVDLDVVVIGDAVRQVESEFDLFWNSPSAYPARTILAGTTPEPREALAARAQAILANPETAKYGDAVAHTEIAQSLLAGTARPEWTTARVVHDDPGKTLDTGDHRELQLLPQLQATFGQAQRSLDLISPYFVPGKPGAEALTELARRGVHVRVITNSLAANDEKSVHSGYMKHRKELLAAGVELLELKPDASTIVRRAHEIGKGSKAGLHAKTYAVDEKTIFVGSFNLDPRSSKLNTEMGVLIDSPTLAGKLHAVVARAYPGLAYRVSLAPDGELQWEDGSGTVFRTEPDTTWFVRALVEVGSWLPIEWLL